VDQLGWMCNSAASSLTATFPDKQRRTTSALKASEKCRRFLGMGSSVVCYANDPTKKFQFHQRQNNFPDETTLGTENIDAYPDFVDGDYNLDTDSPCEDEGVYTGYTIDFDGRLRDNPPEIGAQEIP
jgi:hypothetical protein